MDFKQTQMTEEQKAKYEEAAKEYAKKEYGSTWITVFEQKDFLAGTEHAHPIGYKEGRQDFKRDLILGIANHTALSAQDIVRIQEVINLIK